MTSVQGPAGCIEYFRLTAFSHAYLPIPDSPGSAYFWLHFKSWPNCQLFGKQLWVSLFDPVSPDVPQLRFISKHVPQPEVFLHTGACAVKDCRYAHSVEELRVQRPGSDLWDFGLRFPGWHFEGWPGFETNVLGTCWVVRNAVSKTASASERGLVKHRRKLCKSIVLHRQSPSRTLISLNIKALCQSCC